MAYPQEESRLGFLKSQIVISNRENRAETIGDFARVRVKIPPEFSDIRQIRCESYPFLDEQSTTYAKQSSLVLG